MNQSLNLNDEQLRLATSRTLPPGAALDAETAALHESFVALGAAVESAAGELEEAALIARLKKTCVETASDDRVIVPARSRHDWWPLLLSGALAAAALVAIVRIATVSQDGPVNIAANPAPNGATQAQPELSNFGRIIAAWSDPLDDEIALASATIQQFTSRDRGFDGSLLDMNDRLEALSQELSNETL